MYTWRQVSSTLGPNVLHLPQEGHSTQRRKAHHHSAHQGNSSFFPLEIHITQHKTSLSSTLHLNTLLDQTNPSTAPQPTVGSLWCLSNNAQTHHWMWKHRSLASSTRIIPPSLQSLKAWTGSAWGKPLLCRPPQRAPQTQTDLGERLDSVRSQETLRHPKSSF